MGGITCITPASSLVLPQQVTRLKIQPSADEIVTKTAPQSHVFPREISASTALQDFKITAKHRTEISDVTPET